MTTDRPDAPARPRADARSNRRRILAAATAVFDRQGHDATLSAIAAEAGVGIGTLYRHFPDRGRLVEEVYRHRVVELCDRAESLLTASSSPRAALGTWLEAFAAHLIANRDLPEALLPALTAGSEFRQETGRLLADAVQSFLDAGTATGEIRDDVTPIDLLRIATGLAMVSTTVAEAAKPIEVVLDGLRPAG